MSDESGPEVPQEEIMSDEVGSAVSAIGSAVHFQVTAPGHSDPADLPPVKFDRLGVHRRVLGHITDEVNHEALGARNTLAALTYDLMNDPNTVNPPATHGRLDVAGRTVEQVTQTVLDMLHELEAAGLVAQREDGSYEVTEAGRVELGS